MINLPSGWRASASTQLLGPAIGLNAASSEPSAFSRVTRLRVAPLTAKKLPPIIILPSGWRAIASTPLLAPRPAPDAESLSRIRTVAEAAEPRTAPALGLLRTTLKVSSGSGMPSSLMGMEIVWLF